MTLANLNDFERAAQSKIPESDFSYYASGAADQITLHDNRSAFNSIKLRPHVLRDVSRRAMDTSILGQPSSMPLLIAPTAMAKLAHPVGEMGIAHAAKKAGIIQCLSTLSNTALETVAAAGAANWLQLYVYQDRSISTRLVERAEAAGYKAIVLTVDAPVPGLRSSITRSGTQLSADLTLENFAEFHDTAATDALPFVTSQFDPSLTWDDLKSLVVSTALPVLVKGILRGDDARRAVDCGAAGIIVSNHGGRQLDTAVSGIQALPEVVSAVGSQTEILVDGGIRRGTDILKALALGARAVLVGRPILWGLAVDGQAGVEQVLAILERELDTAMALCGCPSVADIGPELINK